jgi:hypothetical protein
MAIDELPEGWPKLGEVELMPVPHGRTQVMTRVTTEDKNDLVRVVNATGLALQDVQRMFLMCGVRAYLAGKFKEKTMLGKDEESVDEATKLHPSMSADERGRVIAKRHELGLEKTGPIENTQAEDDPHDTVMFDPELPPGVTRDS